MSFRIYDSATRSVREFIPLRPGAVSIYVCGATVQAPPHLGHARSGVIFDVLRRWLMHRGYEVTLIRNVTDIDDKILRKAADAQRPWWAWAALQERLFRAAYDVLGCLPPTHEPRATGHITEMVELTRRLIHARHAYAAGGDVYFSVRSFPQYGQLSRLDPEVATPSDGLADESPKRERRDFALWKRSKPGEPATASWPTPWGRARPGWHLECSAMSTRYLGAAFDIHGGGIDLLFPHHENELAQSRAAGQSFAQYWVHNRLLTVADEKMSKSQDNSILVADTITRWRPIEVRYYLCSAHYRSTLEFSRTALDDAARAYRRIEGFIARADELLGADRTAVVMDDALPEAFAHAMDGDLGVPEALGVIHSTVRRGNAALDAGDMSAVQAALHDTLRMTHVLGLGAQQRPTAEASGLRPVVDVLIKLALTQRAAARARNDFAEADAIRKQLTDIGITVQDTEGESRWELSPTAHV